MKPTNIYPIYEIEQPSTKKILRFRPYVVKEEKILLMAKESKQINDIFNALVQIAKVCNEELNLNVDTLPIFDLEYIFAKLRAFSVTNVETAYVIDKEDGKEHPIIIDFNEIKVKFPDPPIDKVIKTSNDVTILMKYPSASIYKDTNENILKKLKSKDMFDLVLSCIDSIYKKDILLKKNKEELIEFLDNLQIPTYRKMKDFLLNMPKIEYRIEYKNSLGNNRYVQFDSIMDFFFFL